VKKTSSNAPVKPIEPPIDPSEYAAALVHEAVWKPTVLPATYTIPENIGDRISRLSASKPVNLVIQPTIPQPALNGTTVHSSETSQTNTDRLVYDAQRQVYALASTIVTEPVEAPKIAPEEAPVEAEVATPEEAVTLVNEPVEAEVATPEEAVTLVSEPVEAPEIASEEAVTLVSEPVEAEVATPKEAVTLVSEPVEAPEIAPEEAVTLVEAPETTPEILAAPDTPVEAEEAQPPTFLEKVSSVIDAVSTAFMNPEADRKDNEAVAEAVQLNPEGIETPATDSNEPETTDVSATLTEPVQAPSLLDRVSAAVEAVAATFKDPDSDKKNPEVVEATAAPEKALDSKTTAVTCPACGSTELRKNGRRQGKQRYACKECGRQFATADAEAEDKPKSQESSTVEASLVKESQPTLEVPEIASNSAKSGSKKAKAKGFGASKKSK
jgi:predicted RNA-binding Zn-ribbon protein involved in translation (DUF1610 family)